MSELSTYNLVRENGELAQFFNIPFEEFERIFNVYQGYQERETPVRSVLQELVGTGTVNGRQASLKFRLQVKANSDGWLRIPLLLSNAILDELPTCPEASTFFVTYEKPRGGFIAWIEAQKGKTYSIELSSVHKIKTFGGNSALNVNLPKATFSNITLDLPIEDVVVQTNQEGTLQESTKTKAGMTRIDSLAVSGDLQLSWHPRNTGSNRSRPIVEVRSTILAFVESLTLVRLQAELDVRSLNTPIDKLVVKLPKNAVLLPHDQSGTTTTVINDEGKVNLGYRHDDHVIQIDFETQSTNPAPILLSATMTVPPNSQNTDFDIQGLVVKDAIRQSGTLDVISMREWQIDWELGPYVTRIPITSTPSLDGVPTGTSSENTLARFEFFQQPFELKLKVQPETPRVDVLPEFFFFFDQNEVRMQCTFRYQLSGVRDKALKIDLRGWNLESLVTNGQSNQHSMDEKTNVVSIPIDIIDPMLKNDFLVTIVAKLPVESEDSEFELPLPNPTATSYSPAVIVFVPKDNIEVIYQIQPLTGASIDIPDSLLDLGAADDRATAYRLSNTLPNVLPIKIHTLQQTIDNHLSVKLSVNDSVVNVDNQIDYNVLHEELRVLWLNIPTSVATSEAFEIRIDGELLPSQNYKLFYQTVTTPNRSIVEINLSKPLLGELRVSVNYNVKLNSAASNPNVPLLSSVPLVHPFWVEESPLAPSISGDIEPVTAKTPKLFPLLVESADLTVLHPNALRVTLTDSQWTQFNEISNLETWESLYTFHGNTNPNEIKLDFVRSAPTNYQGTTVEKLWMLTRFSKNDRYDRVVYRLKSDRSRVRINLPFEVALEQLAVNGQAYPDPSNNLVGRSITVDLPEDALDLEHTIEIWYRLARERSHERLINIQPPKIEGLRWVRACFIQVALPPDEHILSASSNYTPELVWQWQSIFWSRQSKLTQTQLEQWIGVAPQPSWMEESNHYLYSSFGSIGEIELVQANRLEILGGVTLSIFIGGVLFLYIPLLRHPISFLILGCITLALAIWIGEAAVQFGQIAVIGIVLLLCVYGLKHLLATPVPARSTPLPSHSSTGTTATLNYSPENSSNLRSTVEPTARPSGSQSEANG